MLSLFSKLFRQKQKQEFQIFADIGTTCVSMVVVEKRDNGFFLSNKTRFEVQETGGDADDKQKIQSYMREYIVSAIKEHGRVPEKLHIGISGTMLDNRFETVHASRKNPQKKLNEVELQELIQGGIDQFSKRDSGMVLAYFSVAHIALDGYVIQELPRAAYPATVAISFFLSFAPQDYWTALTGIAGMFGGLPVQFYPNQYLAGTVLPQLLGIRDGVFVDVGGTITEVSIINGQKLGYVATVDYGGEQITAHFAEFLNINSKKEAKDLKKQYDHFWFSSEKKTRAVEDGLRESARIWRKKLDAVFSSVYTVTVPAVFFLFGGGANFSPLIGALEDSSGERYIASGEITVKKISAEDLHLSYIPGSERLHGPDAVMLAALIANGYGI